MGPPLEGAKEAVLDLLGAGFDVRIFTARGDLNGHVSRWLAYYGFPALPITDIKLTAFDVIVDDKAVRFTSWGQFRLPPELTVRGRAPGRPRPSRR